jgi:cell division GTPase FtsZ
MKVVPPTTTSPKLEDLLSQKTRFDKALTRCRKAIASIETFHGSLDVQHVQALHLGEMQQGITVVAENLDEKLLGLEEKLEEVTKAIEEERKVLGEIKVDDNLRKQVSITVFAERDREVEVVLIYGVPLLCPFKFS